MRAWELAVILAGISFAALCIYLITVLKKLGLTLTKLNAILDDNKSGVNDIISNVGTISGDVGTVTARTKQAVESISSKVENIKLPESPQQKAQGLLSLDSPALKTAISAAGILFSGAKVLAKMSENARTKKLIRALKQSRNI